MHSAGCEVRGEAQVDTWTRGRGGEGRREAKKGVEGREAMGGGSFLWGAGGGREGKAGGGRKVERKALLR